MPCGAMKLPGAVLLTVLAPHLATMEPSRSKMVTRPGWSSRMKPRVKDPLPLGRHSSATYE